MMFKKMPQLRPDDEQIYARIDDDGLCRLTCTADYPEFVAWLAEGNTVLPPDEVTE